MAMESLLPPETLSLIFSFLPLLDPQMVSFGGGVPHWCNILHVCKRWRGVALQCKDLWQTIHLGNVNWTYFFINYSKPRNLSVHITSCRQFHSKRALGLEGAIYPEEYSDPSRQSRLAIIGVLNGVLKTRVEELSVIPADFATGTAYLRYRHVNELEEVFERLWDSKVECLQRFTCASYDWQNGDLFSGEPVPTLRHLKLLACRMRWSQPILIGTFTSLHLDSTGMAGSLDELLAVLRHTAETIEDLRIVWRGRGAINSEVNSEKHDIISMPNLKRFELRDFARFVLPVFQHLSIPSNAELSIECILSAVISHSGTQDTRSPEEALAIIEDTFARNMRPLHEMKYSFPAVHIWRTSAEVNDDDDYTFTISASSGHPPKHMVPSRVLLTLVWPKTHETLALTRLWSAIPCTQQPSILKGIDGVTSLDDWLSVRDKVANVTMVEPSASGLRSLLGVLLDERTPFKAIRSLVVQNIDFEGEAAGTFNLTLALARRLPFIIFCFSCCKLSTVQRQNLSAVSYTPKSAYPNTDIDVFISGTAVQTRSEVDRNGQYLLEYLEPITRLQYEYISAFS